MRLAPIVIALTACLGTPVRAAAAAPATQPLLIETVHGTVLHDARRDKDVRVTVHVPEREGAYPLIVFSHGAGGSGENYGLLTTAWAKRGYVVIQPTHADSIALMDRDQRRNVRPADVVLDAVTDVNGWQERPRDVSFVLDSLDELEKRIPALAGKIDRDRIGVGGHSYGAMTTTILAGGKIRTKAGGELLSLADPRVKAAIAMSGQGEGQMGFTKDSWGGLTIPLMVMTGSEDKGAKGQDPMWRKAPFANSPAGGKYWVFIDGATHMSFSGHAIDGKGLATRLRRAGSEKPGTDQHAIFDVVTSATTAFWDAYLRGDAGARERLASGDAVKHETIRVDFEQR